MDKNIFSNFIFLLSSSCHSLIICRKITSELVVKTFIERCREVNGELNAVVEERFTAAMEEAKNVDRLIQSNQKTVDELEAETPLLGVPITVKEACKVEG